jgi:transposase-like protein
MENCPTCSKPYQGFKNDKSMAEYRLSGMCQQCQDDFFGEDISPFGLPTGKCRDCGKMCYNGNEFCSKSCEVSYMKYLNANGF